MLRRSRSRLTTLAIVLAIVMAVPALALATDFMTDGGFLFDLQDGLGGSFETDGTFDNGSIDAYDYPAYQLLVNGTPYSPTGTAVLTMGGRQSELAVQTIGAVTAQRFVYVPATGGDFARILDVIANPGTAPASATIALHTDLGSDGGESITGSSSGDTLCTTVDGWCGSDDGPGGDPSLGHVFQGDGASVRASSISIGGGFADWSFSVTVPAGGRVAVLTFAIQKNDPASVATEAMRLDGIPDDVMVGLDDYLGDLVNFAGDTPGAPRIRFTAPPMANEGDSFDVTVDVTDTTATPTWSWDLDGDGTFGDMPGATTYTVPAGSTDGPSTFVVSVQATNGTVTGSRRRTVAIQNVAPTLDTSTPPPATTSDGANYTYQIVANDPAGAADPLAYTCTTCPGTMTVSSTGFVSWTSGDLDVTMPLMPDHVTITVDDGDMGSTALHWDLTVLANHPPTRPTAIYPSTIAVAELTPRFVAGNATDEDGDALSYFFEIDTVETFDSPGKISSPGVPQTDGFTAFRPTTPLGPGLQYFWRVRANDGMADSDYAMTTFYTAGTPIVDAGTPDAGSGGDASTPTDAGHGVPPRGGGCCTIGAGAEGTGDAPGAPGGGAISMLGVVALLLGRRRKSL